MIDQELIRRRLLGEDVKWTTLGQSFGGFCTLTYLSLAPHGLEASLITGGLSPVAAPSLAPSLVPTVNGNAVRSFSTHGQQSAAKGSSTTVSRSDTRLIQYLESSALWSDGPEVALNWQFPYFI
jgi:hypothetical protein